MIDPSLATIIAAVIALAGTMIGVAVGYRRWSRERTAQRFARFETDRQDVYRSLWDRVEQINAALRRDRVDEVGFSQLVADLNEFIIRNGAHVDDADYQLVNQYVTAVRSFHEVVSRLEPEVQVPYGRTQTIPPDVVNRVKELGEAQQHVTKLRNELRTKVRMIIGGTT